jgi:hypothetical protein
LPSLPIAVDSQLAATAEVIANAESATARMILFICFLRRRGVKNYWQADISKQFRQIYEFDSSHPDCAISDIAQ